MPVPLPSFWIVQTVTCEGTGSCPPSAIGDCPPPQSNRFHLFIYLLNYLLLPLLVWPFNDSPGGERTAEHLPQAQMTIHFICCENKS